LHPPRLVRVAAPLLVGALVLTACGSEEEDGGDATENKTLSIGVVAPLTGDLTAIGNGIKNGVELAIKDANEKKMVKGVTLKLAAQDDTGKANVGATVAAKLVADNSVVGVVGPLNSSVARSVAPVMARSNLAIISPANSATDLTGRDKLVAGQTQVRPHKSYFRIVATDDIQGPFAADFAVKTLSKKRIAVVHDKKAYGQGLAEAFIDQAKKNGATVLKTETVTVGEKEFGAVIDKIKAQNPDFLFYGGEYPEAAPFTKQMKAKGLNIPLMGGDGVQSSEYVKIAGAAANGDFATGFGAPTSTLSSAKDFLADYKAAGYKVDPDPYGAPAYDAAMAIIRALAKAVEEDADATGQALRDEVTKELADTSFDGVTGPISFDEFGDTNNKVLTAYEIKNGKYEAANTAAFK
jgi:branched-chain amino acid transport system substrate-binding protein